MSRTFTGRIKGKIIKLDDDPHLPDDEVVRVQIKLNRLEHLKKALGQWKDDPQLDSAFKKIARDRKRAKISGVRS